MLLPEGLAVQGYPVELDTPGIEIEGRHGEAVDRGLAKVKSGDIMISGTVFGVDKDGADKIRADILRFAYNFGPICIYRHAEADRYVVGDLINVDHAYRVGHFGGRMFSLGLRFIAFDPFQYSTSFTHLKFLPPVTTMIVPNAGGVEIGPIIWLTGPAEDPRLYNHTTGQSLQYNGILAEGEIIAVDCTGYRAHSVLSDTSFHFLYPAQANGQLVGDSVLLKMGEDWLMKGFSLAPGDNIIEASSKNEFDELSVQFAFRARWL